MSFWRRSKKTPADSDRQWREENEPRIKAAKEERQRRLVGQEETVAQLELLLFKNDPMGINFEDNVDEYRAEAETITLRLPEATSEADLLRIVHGEFVLWFGADTAGPPSRYVGIASEIWSIVRRS